LAPADGLALATGAILSLLTSQRAIILLSCCLGICLFALGFLLGRESNRAPAAVVSAPPGGVAATREPVPVPAPSRVPAPTLASPALPAAASRAAEPPAAPPPARASRTRAAPTRTSPESASPAVADDSAGKEAVARYFHEVDRLQNIDVDNPEAAATSLIGAATSGDTSGLRRLVVQARDTEQRVRAITPPPPCAHYHERLVSMLAESHSLLQGLEKGLGGGDLESVPALVSQANSAKSRSEALVNEAREIKRHYGVAP